MNKLLGALAASLIVFCLALGCAHATVVIGGTRVVFPAGDGETTLRLTNEGAQPALVQAWIDRGNPASTPAQADVPFLITPPLFRMDPRKGQSLRIVYTREPLPADRETLFWLNVLEVPPKPGATEGEQRNYLQLAIRSRLKLFFRPAGLPGDALKAPASVTWKLVSDDKGRALEAHNPTPYYITFNAITLNIGDHDYAAETGMIEPFGSLRLTVANLPATHAAATVEYGVINDYGAAAQFEGQAAP